MKSAETRAMALRTRKQPLTGWRGSGRRRGKLERSPGLRRVVIEQLREDYSPEQVAGTLRQVAGGKTVISHETIYQFIRYAVPMSPTHGVATLFVRRRPWHTQTLATTQIVAALALQAQTHAG